MNSKINIIWLLVLFGLTVHAQKHPSKKNQNKPLVIHKIKGLKISEIVPDVPLTKIVKVDGTVSSGMLSDYNDRLLILDFMYTSCGACIEGLPKKDHLQREFGDKVKIMVVIGGEVYSPGMLRRENEGFIRKFLTNKKSFLSRNNVQLPWIVENRLLNQYFPHQFVSHLVWIYKGKLVAITEQDYVTAENIQTILDGRQNDWPVKNDFMPVVDVKVPLIRQDMHRFTGDKALDRYVAILGPYQDGVITKIGVERDSINNTRRDYIINLPILNIYISRWGLVTNNSKLLEPSHILLEVKNTSRYINQEDSTEPDFVVRRRTRICYESLGPDTNQTDKQVAYAMIKDLDNLLGLHGRYEKRKMKCLILVKTGSLDNIKTKIKGGESFGVLSAPNVKMINKGLSVIVWKLNQFYGNPPVFDETQYKENVDMDFKINSWQDIPAVQKVLRNYGLDLKEEERDIDVFVLTENTIRL